MEEVAINPTIELPELTQDWEANSWRAQTEPCVHQEKGAVTPQETDPGLPVSVWESPADVWVSGGLLYGLGTECNTVCMGPCGGCRHCIHCLHHSLVTCQTTGREHNPIYEQKIELKVLSMVPPITARPSFPLSQSLPSGSFHKPLILLHQREDRLKTAITEN